MAKVCAPNERLSSKSPIDSSPISELLFAPLPGWPPNTMGHHLSQTNQIRRISQAALDYFKPVPSQRLFWKTDERDPRKHNETHLGLFYQLPDKTQITRIYGQPSPFKKGITKVCSVWDQMQIMVRQPALSAINHLRSAERSDLNTKLLLYGTRGQGKSFTLAHLVHYLHLNQDHFIVQVKYIRKFTRSPFEINDSSTRTGRIDTPIDSALLLQQIRIVNADLFEKYNDVLLCTQDYHWSLREVTKAGEPLIKVAEHGVNRVNHASDCVAVLLKELMLAADEGKIKLATVIHDLRWLYEYEVGVLKHKDFRKILVDEVTVARALKKLIKNKGKGALVLTSCDDLTYKSLKVTPEEILGDEGMEHLDGCTRIHVPKYSRQEFENCMNYYQDIGWLCRPEARTQEARDELRFISGMNPSQLEYLCRSM